MAVHVGLAVGQYAVVLDELLDELLDVLIDVLLGDAEVDVEATVLLALLEDSEVLD